MKIDNIIIDIERNPELVKHNPELVKHNPELVTQQLIDDFKNILFSVVGFILYPWYSV